MGTFKVLFQRGDFARRLKSGSAGERITQLRLVGNSPVENKSQGARWK